MPIRHPAGLVLCLGIAGMSLPAADFSDDFNDGDDGGWVHYDPLGGLGLGGNGIWSFPAGTYRMQATPASAPGSTGPARVGSYRTDSFAEFVVTADFVGWDSDLNELFGVLARMSQPGLGSTAGYALAYGTRTGQGVPGRFELFRIANEVGATLAYADHSLQPGHQYRFIFSGKLDQLHAEVYELSNSVPATNPIVILNASDATYANGYTGVFGYDNSRTENNSVDFTIDNFSAAAPRPTLTMARGPDNTTIITWPRWATAYQLQRTSDLSPPRSWTQVTWNITSTSTDYIFSDLSDDTQFFRLLKP